jgi:phosphoribosylamine-glycine ligase
MWLLKPTGLNRGRGIHIFTTMEELKNILIENYDVNFFGSSTNQSIVTSNKTSQL